LSKHKLKRFKEMKGFNKVFEPSFEEYFNKDHPLKNNWKYKVFQNDHPLFLELGCGKGEYTVGLARKFPDINIVGVDIKGARMWKGSKTAQEEKIENVAWLRTRIEFINSFFGEDEVDEIWLTFPDPQIKKGRQKKRLTGVIFMNKYQKLLRDRGIIHLKTDNEYLFNYTCGILQLNEIEILSSVTDLYNSALLDDILSIRTFYEGQYLASGSRIYYLRFRLPKYREIHEYEG
jgi:tRNA (guanine-N7-)-methyltransferase